MTMIIAHEKLIGEGGEPRAAVIPWDIFLAIQDQIKAEDGEVIEDAWKEEIRERVKGIDEGKIPLLEHDDVMSRVRSLLATVR